MVEVLQPGLYTSIQDQGRFDSLHYGVPISGSMDQVSAKIANAIVNNTSNCALLEMTFNGPFLLFKTPTSICVSGADMQPQLNGMLVKMNTAIAVKSGDKLKMQFAKKGSRTYLAIRGGFKTPKVMNSQSMYKNITKNFRLLKGDQLAIEEGTKPIKSNTILKVSTNRFENPLLDVYKGPEFNQLSKDNISELMNTLFSISNESNRMAYPLIENITNNLEPIITSLVLPGTVQLTPGGKLIILMRDCQITGGYPRILQLTEDAINTLAQKKTNNQIQFHLV